ncbi:MAG: hypothetical protein IIB00_02460 [candidate division Zixibacteria bacterium]|nr:hypothetical protein [candidate division Zixibacteria bacterium]
MSVGPINGSPPLHAQSYKNIREGPDPTTSGATIIIDDGGSSDDSDDGGVVSLLQEGHFAGVASARLHINFYEELLAAQTDEQTQALTDGITEITASVSSNIETLLGSEDLTEEQIQAIRDALNAFADPSTTDDPIITVASTIDVETVESLSSLYQSAFDNLLADLTAVLIVAEPEGSAVGEVVDGEEVTTTSGADGDSTTVATEGDGETITTDFQALLDSLKELFDSEFVALLESLNEISYLSVDTEPNGNGVAFDKFMAIYNDIISGEGSADPGSSEPLDISA